MDTKPISLNAFGKLIGVSCEAVRKAISTGRLKRSVVRSKTGMAKIGNVELAKEEWGENTAASFQRNKQAQSDGAKAAIARRTGKEPAPVTGLPSDAPVDISEFNAAEHGSAVPNVNTSNRVREYYRALKEKREFERESGLLIPVAESEAIYSRLIVEAKTRLMAVSTKAKNRIPALTASDCLVIDDLIREALLEISGKQP
ncbi:terminase small subunit [Pararheinheimera phage vB_PsoM_KLER1-1]|nr:terminase small subunit [Pararheinheimera phage vB_PsoM_KLER1-1]